MLRLSRKGFLCCFLLLWPTLLLSKPWVHAHELKDHETFPKLKWVLSQPEVQLDLKELKTLGLSAKANPAAVRKMIKIVQETQFVYIITAGLRQIRQLGPVAAPYFPELLQLFAVPNARVKRSFLSAAGQVIKEKSLIFHLITLEKWRSKGWVKDYYSEVVNSMCEVNELPGLYSFPVIGYLPENTFSEARFTNVRAYVHTFASQIVQMISPGNGVFIPYLRKRVIFSQFPPYEEVGWSKSPWWEKRGPPDMH